MTSSRDEETYLHFFSLRVVLSPATRPADVYVALEPLRRGLRYYKEPYQSFPTPNKALTSQILEKYREDGDGYVLELKPDPHLSGYALTIKSEGPVRVSYEQAIRETVKRLNPHVQAGTFSVGSLCDHDAAIDNPAGASWTSIPCGATIADRLRALALMIATKQGLDIRDIVEAIKSEFPEDAKNESPEAVDQAARDFAEKLRQALERALAQARADFARDAIAALDVFAPSEDVHNGPTQ